MRHLRISHTEGWTERRALRVISIRFQYSFASLLWIGLLVIICCVVYRITYDRAFQEGKEYQEHANETTIKSSYAYFESREKLIKQEWQRLKDQQAKWDEKIDKYNARISCD